MEKAVFCQLVAFATMVSIGLVGFGAILSQGMELTWLNLLLFLAGMFGGVIIFSISSNPFVSTFGVALMSISAGLLVGPITASYEVTTVMQAVIITGGIVVVMSSIGILYPKIFEGMGPYLLAGLTVLIFSQFAQIIFLALGFEQAASMPILAWIGIGIFTLYVGYDWSRALSLPHTADNAIDAAGAITLDAINIFLRVLQILGGSSGNKKRD